MSDPKEDARARSGVIVGSRTGCEACLDNAFSRALLT